MSIGDAWKVLWGGPDAVKAAPPTLPASAYGTVPGFRFGSWDMASPLTTGTRTNWAAEAAPLWLSVPVMACLTWYVRNLPSADPAVFTPSADDSQEDTADFAHPAVACLDGADGMDRNELLAFGYWSYLLWGKAYYLIVEDVGSVPTRLAWLAPEEAMTSSFLRPRPRERGETQLIGAYEYWVDGKVEAVYDPEDVVYVRNLPDPYDPAGAMSPLLSNLVSIVGYNRAITYLAGYMKHGAARNLFVPELQTTWDEATAEGIKRQIGGIDLSRDNWIPVSSVPGRLESIGGGVGDVVTADAMDRLECNTCALMGLSPMVVNLASGATQRTFANYEEADRQAWSHGAIPVQDAFGAAFTRSLLPRFGEPGDKWFGFDRTKVAALGEDKTARIARAQLMAGGKRWASTNEIRAEAGLPPLDWGDDLDEEPVPVVPMPGDAAGVAEGEDESESGETPAFRRNGVAADA